MLRLSVIAVVSVLLLGLASGSVKERLIRDLLRDYVPHVDPGNIDLTFGVSFQCADYDKDTDILTSSAWESYAWKDARLSWDPEEYANIDTLRVDSKLIWTPDMRLYNSLGPEVERDETNAVLKSDGSLIWIPRVMYRTRCTEQTDGASCNLKIGSWTYDGNSLNLKASPTLVDLTNYDAACPDVVASHKAEIVSHTYPCCPEPYPSLDMNLVVKARAE